MPNPVVAKAYLQSVLTVPRGPEYLYSSTLESLFNGFIGVGTEIPGHFKNSIYLGKTKTKPLAAWGQLTDESPQVLAVLSAPHLETIFMKMAGDVKQHGQSTDRMYFRQDSTVALKIWRSPLLFSTFLAFFFFHVPPLFLSNCRELPHYLKSTMLFHVSLSLYMIFLLWSALNSPPLFDWLTNSCPILENPTKVFYLLCDVFFNGL